VLRIFVAPLFLRIRGLSIIVAALVFTSQKANESNRVKKLTAEVGRGTTVERKMRKCTYTPPLFFTI
jgi:hypothetical protein